MISTKGRYALRVMIDLAEHDNGNYIPLKDIAERQEISKKYLEIIVKEMVSGGLIIGASGKGGGYKLVKKPDKYKFEKRYEQVYDIQTIEEAYEAVCEYIDTLNLTYQEK